MENIELISIAAVLIFGSFLAYKSKFFHNKKIGYISFLQIFYLILIPGLLYTIIFSYLLDVLDRPLNDYVFIKDKILISLLLLSILYTYGGLAIHGVAKTVSSYFEKKDRDSLVFKVNEYFHMNFSHNLTFIGGVVTATCFALLELNHFSPYPKESSFLIIILNGCFIGLASVLGLSVYKRRWLELKFFFGSLWLMIIVLIYAVKPYIKNVESYPFTLMLLVAFSILAGLNIFLYVRRIKNKIRINLKVPKDFFE
ncbi:hypothetical protein COT75_04900 [Candidatus Beckwithbacteria bacterium CG10_big_fil_rev_8_21_14_0_10_34_10]|uniref:Uncharacterized protein n=1 Tax=Candidatus Beckwithbacteria bacterium CG10_big_fil_rev_8_21_14_0_10_34_10 TaxID=1974495 RepID=A0A2H0W802_9BACT|nr:MAG: hypothetical protein COT75_04900 [Candidatus Beckwithbacteria bacterium CG10_big_fil_rev_8_21_14_0_10_34_10]